MTRVPLAASCLPALRAERAHLAALLSGLTDQAGAVIRRKSFISTKRWKGSLGDGTNPKCA